ncbi:MAG: hypothetical protein WCE92_02135, partial [Nitrososphaeraceae archaeon]
IDSYNSIIHNLLVNYSKGQLIFICTISLRFTSNSFKININSDRKYHKLVLLYRKYLISKDTVRY